MNASAQYIPDRGDIIWMSFDPQAGHEQALDRPAIVLSSRANNARSGLAIVCPITSQVKGYQHEVPIPSGLPVYGVVQCDQIKSQDWQARGASFVCQAPVGLVTAVIGGVLRAIS